MIVFIQVGLNRKGTHAQPRNRRRLWIPAQDGLRDYVNSIVDSTEGPETADQYGSVEAYWLATGVVEAIGTDGCNDTIQAVFNRAIASVDYAEVTVCYEDCRAS